MTRSAISPRLAIRTLLNTERASGRMRSRRGGHGQLNRRMTRIETNDTTTATLIQLGRIRANSCHSAVQQSVPLEARSQNSHRIRFLTPRSSSSVRRLENRVEVRALELSRPDEHEADRPREAV